MTVLFSGMDDKMIGSGNARPVQQGVEADVLGIGLAVHESRILSNLGNLLKEAPVSIAKRWRKDL